MTTHDIHEVFNQAEALTDVNLFDVDHAMQDALKFNAPELEVAPLRKLGQVTGSAEMQAHARLANIHTPELHRLDPRGRRIDEVEFHPSYHVLMNAATRAGLHGTPWAADLAPTLAASAVALPPEGALAARGGPSPLGAAPHMQRAAGFMLFTQLEASVLCPISMTYAVTPALRENAKVYADWGPKLTSRAYDPRLVSYKDKPGVTMGMGMTERQGGSDVRANTSQATPDGSDRWGERYRLNGHKWFFSAPMCDAFLVLAQAAGGLTCFFLPRVLPDGTRNGLRIQRLKDKLGNKANASSEVEFDNALAWRVGDEDRGVAQILEMGTRTRLDCSLGTAALMRQSVCVAVHHTRQRKAFGKFLIEQPLMKNVLADMALESEAATALALRLARSYERHADEHERLIARVITPVSKYWICKRGSLLAQEAMECQGGNGYIEEDGFGVMARVYREMPVNSIWEGAGNIMAIDLLRALRKGDVTGALQHELGAARGVHPALDRAIQTLPDRIEALANEMEARRLAEDVALTVQAALLAQTAPASTVSAFCDSRLNGQWGHAFGTLPASADCDALIERALPA
ncbi:MAG: DNA alkylation response protein [Burkholderiaceae bacterium]|jgi:putative acyl-CoA dehydrogenase|nr:MAG: DNA alkylation response protein [Burkholderiaceae bacterium]